MPSPWGAEESLGIGISSVGCCGTYRDDLSASRVADSSTVVQISTVLAWVASHAAGGGLMVREVAKGLLGPAHQLVVEGPVEIALASPDLRR